MVVYVVMTSVGENPHICTAFLSKEKAEGYSLRMLVRGDLSKYWVQECMIEDWVETKAATSYPEGISLQQRA